MTVSNPPGFHHNPSAWSRRLRIVALAGAGFLISTYLACYQMGLVPSVWDPLFGNGSVRVLHSAISKMLPVPDAMLGAVGYLVDLALVLAGGSDRWRTWPVVVLMLGGVSTAMAVVSAILVFLQLVVIGSACTLCLASACLSFVILPLAWEEVAGVVAGMISI